MPIAVGSAMSRYSTITGKGFTRSQQIIYDNVAKTVKPLCENDARLLQIDTDAAEYAELGYSELLDGGKKRRRR